MNSSVKLAIPETGRMAQETLAWLAKRNVVEAKWAAKTAEALDKTRKLDSETVAKKALLAQWNQGLEGITLKPDLRSGWRIAVSAVQTEQCGIDTLIYGSQYPTISGIREGLADAAVIGLDDLFAATVPYLARSSRPKTWDALNRALLPRNSTDVRVVGSTGLEDYAGICLLLPTNGGIVRQKLAEAMAGLLPVYVKGKNQGLAYYLLGRKADARPTEMIEDAVTADKCFGLDVVRTGKTAVERELHVLPPLLFTFSVVAVDITKYVLLNSDGKKLRDFVECIKPRNNPQDDYGTGMRAWENSVKNTLGKLWVGP